MGFHENPFMNLKFCLIYNRPIRIQLKIHEANYKRDPPTGKLQNKTKSPNILQIESTHKKKGKHKVKKFPLDIDEAFVRKLV